AVLLFRLVVLRRADRMPTAPPRPSANRGGFSRHPASSLIPLRKRPLRQSEIDEIAAIQKVFSGLVVLLPHVANVDFIDRYQRSLAILEFDRPERTLRLDFMSQAAQAVQNPLGHGRRCLARQRCSPVIVPIGGEPNFSYG